MCAVLFGRMPESMAYNKHLGVFVVQLSITAAGSRAKPRRRYRWLWIGLATFLLLLIAGFIYAAWPGHSTFTVSPETTYVTGPLDKDGYVDYVTAVNERLRGNIKPEDNANVLLWQAIGPHPEGGTVPEDYWLWLGAPPPQEKKGYFIRDGDYWKQLTKDENNSRETFEEFDKRMSKAIRWPWRAQDEPELTGWLKQNEKALASVKEATLRSEYYNPVMPRTPNDGSRPMLIGALLPNVQVCRGIAAALVCRAMLRVNEGKTEEAWQDLMACPRLGRLLGRGASLIELLVGIAIDSIADGTDVAFLQHGKLTSDQLQRCLRDLQRLPAMPTVADKLDVYERFMFLDALMCLASEWPRIDESNAFSIKPKRTLSLKDRLFTRNINFDPALQNVNRAYDQIRDGSRLTDRNARSLEMDKIDQEFRLPAKRPSPIEKFLMGPKSRGEELGRILIELLLPAIAKLQAATERCEQNQRNLYLAFALAAYYADNGRYPEALAELAPKYLDTIPDDIYSGKPLIYKPEANGYLLYSVGANGIDEGGQTLGDDPPGDDLVVRMPIQEPKMKK
jgi:hypothetical protein